MTLFHATRASCIKNTNECVRIHYVEDKPDNARRLLILLHGFPLCWVAWKPYITRFAAMGFHVVVPDLRGFNDSDKPDNKSEYEMTYLINDVLQLIDHLGYEKAIVIGHEWGGAITWELAEYFPDVIQAAIVINCPHRGAVAKNIRKSPMLGIKQLLKSWHILFFQLPLLPEVFIRCCNYYWLEAIFRSWSSREKAFSAEDIANYKSALNKPGALTGSINYFRANIFNDFGRGILKAVLGRKVFRKISVPSMLIWGDRDPVFHIGLTEGTEEYFTGPFKLVHFDDASHWILQDYPERIVYEVEKFINALSNRV